MPLLLVSVAALSCVCTPNRDGPDLDDRLALSVANSFTLNRDQAMADLTEMTKGPHPMGSPRQAELAGWLAERVTASGATASREPFDVQVPNPAALHPVGPALPTLSRSGTNVYARHVTRVEAPCVVALASHYDTKDIEGLRYVGANDSGSSSVVLLQQIAHLHTQRSELGQGCDIIGIWFDGEESVLANWSDGETRHPAKLQDNTYGSRHAVQRMIPCHYEGQATRCLPEDLGGRPLVALILMDMIGSPGLRLTRDRHSTPDLLSLAESGARALGFQDVFGPASQIIEDDHVPYLKAGIPALDLIDFHNLDYWHRPGDEVPAISLESMEIAGKLALYVATQVAQNPKVFLAGSEK